MADVSVLKANFHKIGDRIREAKIRFGRERDSIELLPVSKGQKLEHIQLALMSAGFPTKLGENYPQELLEKIENWGTQVPMPEWHFIGRIQSRKIKELVGAGVHVFQSVSRTKELEILCEQWLKTSKSGQGFFVQVNVSKESQKGGVAPQEFVKIWDFIEEKNLASKFLGLMCLASDFEKASEKKIREEFSLLRKIREKHFSARQKCALSMGMSGDLEWAIAEGSDMLRVGSSLFGPRRL